MVVVTAPGASAFVSAAAPGGGGKMVLALSGAGFAAAAPGGDGKMFST
jgi:hypothetical protein